jgi:hypothetical protein
VIKIIESFNSVGRSRKYENVRKVLPLPDVDALQDCPHP